jgi:opacity protein-like surface antigen
MSMWFPSRKIARLVQAGAVAAAGFVFCAAAGAQVPTSGNVFFGYSYENAGASSFELSNLGRPNLNGWEASLEGRVFPWVGLVADFGRHYASQNYQFTQNGITTTVSDGEEFTVLFGPRVSVPLGKFRPFAEALFGAAHTNASQGSSLPDNFVQPRDTSFATALGGGLDYKIIRPIAIRIEGDYVQTRFFGETQNNIRISTGIVFRF